MEAGKLAALVKQAGQSLKADLPASIVVFLVALPLCMGIAIASGVPADKAAAVGVITGIIGGIVVGVTGGSPLQVSGPAAGLTVLIFELVQQHGWESVGLVVLLAGILQVLFGSLRLGQWFRAVSPAVIHGMLAGIGILIVASQFHIMLDDQPKGSGIANIMSIPRAVKLGIVPSADHMHDVAARVGILSILVLLLWQSFAPKRLRFIPAPLLAVVVATIVTAALGLTIKKVAIPGNLLDAVHLPSFSTVSKMGVKALAISSLSIAFIASAETLLCATAVDKMHRGPRTRYDRELAAQGIGNILAGTLGALPMTGVIVRSAANVEAGAKSRASAILHGVWLLVFVTLFPMLLRWVPTSCLAAILVYTGYKLINPKAVKELWKYSKSEVAIYFATVITIVATDLLTGVVTGLALSFIKLIYAFSHLAIRMEHDASGKRTILFLEGAATFIRLPKLAAALEQIPPSSELHVHFEQLTHIDHACLDLLMSWEKQHQATGGSLVVDWETLTARFRHFGANGARAETGNNGVRKEVVVESSVSRASVPG